MLILDPDWVIDQLVKIGREFSVVQLGWTDAVDGRWKGKGVSLPFAFAELSLLFVFTLGLPFGVAFSLAFPFSFTELFGSSSLSSLLFAFSLRQSSPKYVAQP